MIALLLLACKPAMLVVSDLHGDKVFVTNAETGHITGEVDVDGTWTADCRAADDKHRFCLVYQSHERALDDGSAEIDLTFTPVGNEDSANGDDYMDFGGRIVGERFPEGVSMDTPDTRWQADHLDFSKVDPDQLICKRDPLDPCEPAAGQSVDAVRACQLYWPHEFQFISEDADSIQLAVADTRNHRVLWLDAPLQPSPSPGPPSTGTCATVTEVVGGTSDPTVPGGSADWDIYTSVNGLNLWTDDAGDRHLYLSIKDTIGDPTQTPGDGHGKILEWSETGGWHQEWEFPPQVNDASALPSFVNSPHGISHDDTRIYFAQSLGDSDAWNDGVGGTFTVLDRDGTYDFDVVLPNTVVRYARDITPLGDGRFALVDSGTKGDEHAPADTHLWLAKLPDAAKSTLSGVWTADHAEQDLETGTFVARPAYKDAWVLYSAEILE